MVTKGLQMENTSIQRFIASVKRYLGLQRDFVMLTLAEKITVILAVVILALVIFALLLTATVFMVIGLSKWLGDVFGCAGLGYACGGVVYVLLAIVVYLNRIRWIVNPVARFIADELLGTASDDADAADDDDADAADEL